MSSDQPRTGARTAKKRAPRRSTEQVRGAILAAAAEEFAQHGVDGATMRAIAARAKVTMSVLHRQFPTKQELFSDILVAPLLGFLSDFPAAWRRQAERPWSDERLSRELIELLVVNLQHHRTAVLGLVNAAAEGDAATLEQLRPMLATTLDQLAHIGREEAARRPSISADDVPTTSLLALATIIGLTLMQPLLPEDRPEAHDPVPDEVVEAISRFVLYGVGMHPPRRTD
ncbi:hypothetical protein DSM112329_00338 [Paraconexibacter sp. AEG42_29]|uniref:HTH tetR-type domain-containing protein n=1 Tax=Paraconexibacter sp. AEG42_29 TaxID=2997339 RepID=A0AAU7APV6_9ACTN